MQLGIQTYRSVEIPHWNNRGRVTRNSKPCYLAQCLPHRKCSLRNGEVGLYAFCLEWSNVAGQWCVRPHRSSAKLMGSMRPWMRCFQASGGTPKDNSVFPPVAVGKPAWAPPHFDFVIFSAPRSSPCRQLHAITLCNPLGTCLFLPPGVPRAHGLCISHA